VPAFEKDKVTARKKCSFFFFDQLPIEISYDYDNKHYGNNVFFTIDEVSSTQ
jgi:hypothetical protein